MFSLAWPNRQNDISYNPTPIETWLYRLTFTRSPGGEALTEAFNQGLEAIQERQKVQVHLNNVANGVNLPVAGTKASLRGQSERKT